MIYDCLSELHGAHGVEIVRKVRHFDWVKRASFLITPQG
jgi:hypothetical protein